MHLAHLASLLRVQAPPKEALQNGPTPSDKKAPPLLSAPSLLKRALPRATCILPNQPWGLPSLSPQGKLLVLQDSSPTSVSLEEPLCLRLLTVGERGRGWGRGFRGISLECLAGLGRDLDSQGAPQTM